MKIESQEKNSDYIKMYIKDMRVGTLFYINDFIDLAHLRLKVHGDQYMNMNLCTLGYDMDLKGLVVPENIKFVISN